MLIKAKALKGYSLKGLDGDIGSAREFFFDDSIGRFGTLSQIQQAG